MDIDIGHGCGSAIYPVLRLRTLPVKDKNRVPRNIYITYLMDIAADPPFPH